MNEEMIIKYCAPTLAALKTGNLFSCSFESRDQMQSSIRCLNCRLAGKGLRIMPLRYKDKKALVYVYRPEKLQRDLQDETACRLLREHGYCCANPTRCVACLREKLSANEDFPHEIGLFLGYPPEDVEGFIYRKDEAKCSGCWKVYGNVERAKRIFARYKKCTDVYLKKWAQGREIEKLTVSA